MNESLAWLRDPAAQPALSDLLCGLIRDIRLILVHPDLGNAAKLGAITHTVDQLAPPPGPEASAAPAAASVAALLARGTSPATALFEELAGEEIRIELTGRADRPASTGNRSAHAWCATAPALRWSHQPACGWTACPSRWPANAPASIRCGAARQWKTPTASNWR